MSKRLVDLESSNLYLFNMLFRQQVYLEGVKVSFHNVFRRMLVELYNEFSKYIGQTRYDHLDSFSKVEIEQFIYRFRIAQMRAYNKYTQQLIELLKQFIAADLEVTRAIYDAVVEHPLAKPKVPTASTSLHGIPAFAHPLIAGTMWSRIADAIIPANGLTINQMLSNFADSSTRRVAALLLMGYANGESVRAAFASIVGSGPNFRGGALAQFSAQNESIILTALQHVSSITQAGIASLAYDKYQWVSVMDSRTTVICRSRNGKIYAYGKGPLPPAHWNCRSKAVSLTQGTELHSIPKSFYDWLRTQPRKVIEDMLGSTKVNENISINNLQKPLTVSGFRSKIDVITMYAIDNRTSKT